MKKSFLSLDQIIYENVNFESTPSFEPQHETAISVEDIDISEEILQHPEEKTQYFIRLKLVLIKEYLKINITVSGHFSIVPSDDEIKDLQLLVVNGLSLLYGSIRDLVLTLSSRAYSNSLILPTVSFADYIKLPDQDGSGKLEEVIP